MQALLDRLVTAQDDNIRQEITAELSLRGRDAVDALLIRIKSGRNLRVYLNALSRIIAKKVCLQRLIEQWDRLNYRPLLDCAQDIDPKVRKSAYIIMGYIDDKKIADFLLSALLREETLFLIPSIILALGKIKLTSAILPIKDRVVYFRTALKDIAEHAKALNEIERAADKALSSLQSSESHTFYSFDKPYQVLLTGMKGYGRVTLSRAKELYQDLKPSGDDVIVVTEDFSSLYRIREFYEALISFESLRDNEYNIDKAIRLLSLNLTIERLNLWHRSIPPYRYRIELKGEVEDRTQEIDKLVSTIKKYYKDDLINSPSDYEMEIRIILNSGKCTLLIKLMTIADKRFSYRLKALPASIKGETAAICMRLVSKYLRPSSKVLDPFVGTGTMLIERAKLQEGAELKLSGTDFAAEAIQYAKENLNAAGVTADVICRDILKYKTDILYDEIISNMPYGLRVGTHSANEKLYYEFMSRMPQLLKPKGVLILLTADYRLLEKAANEYGYRLIDKYIISSGGLYPHLMVFMKS